jgi:hypothetical protein
MSTNDTIVHLDPSRLRSRLRGIEELTPLWSGPSYARCSRKSALRRFLDSTLRVLRSVGICGKGP